MNDIERAQALRHLLNLPGDARVDTKAVALLHDVCEKTVARWVARGLIAPPVTGPGVRPRWRLDAVR